MPSNNASSDPKWTIIKTLEWTADYFRHRGIAQSRAVAEILLAHILCCQRIDLYMRHDQPLNEEELARYKQAIRRRTKFEPEAYIVGQKEFWSLPLQVSPDVLIPRPETECLVESVLEKLPADDIVNALELGVGSGAISIALAHERPQWCFWASDISHHAIGIARANAMRLLPTTAIMHARSGRATASPEGARHARWGNIEARVRLPRQRRLRAGERAPDTRLEEEPP